MAGSFIGKKCRAGVKRGLWMCSGGNISGCKIYDFAARSYCLFDNIVIPLLCRFAGYCTIRFRLLRLVPTVQSLHRHLLFGFFPSAISRHLQRGGRMEHLLS